MKKISLFCGMALCLGLVACDNFDLPNPPAQSNPEQAVFASTDLVLSQADPEVNLVTYNAEETPAPLARIDKLDNFPAPYELKIEAEVAADESFERVSTIETTVADDMVTVSPDAFNGAIRDVITKDPSIVNVAVRLVAYAEYGASKVRLGEGTASNYGVYTYSVKPFDPVQVIEDTYYLVGNFCNWDVKKGLAFNHTTAGSVYDNPTFSVKFDVDAAQAAAGYEWKVVPASAVAAGTWDGAMGVVAGEDGRTGRLIDSPEAEANAGVISAESPYLITIDLDAMTYEVSLAIETLWVPTPGTSASNFAKILTLSTDNYINYRGVSPLRGNFWFVPQASLRGVEYFQDPDAASVAADGVQTGGLIIRDTENKQHQKISVDKTEFGTANALYWIDVNLVLMNYKITRLNTVSLVGAFNGWNAAEAVALTPSKDFLTYTGTVDLEGEFKINTNGNWDIDFGGIAAGEGAPSAQIVYKGANLSVEAGTYDVTVKFNTVPYTIELVKH